MPNISKLGWPAGQLISESLIGALDTNENKNILNMAITLAKDGKNPEIINYLSNDQDALRIIFDSYLNDSKEYTSCHDVSSELNKILGVEGEGRTFGSLNEDKREHAIEAVQNVLRNSTPSVMHVRYSSQTNDGHSFTLVHRGVNELSQTMEAWAVNSQQKERVGDFHSIATGLLDKDNYNAQDYPYLANAALANAVQAWGVEYTDVVKAFDEIISSKASERDHGLRTLSRSGGIAAFEPIPLQEDGKNMRLEVTVRELDTKESVERKISDRMDIIRSVFSEMDRAAQQNTRQQAPSPQPTEGDQQLHTSASNPEQLQQNRQGYRYSPYVRRKPPGPTYGGRGMS
jgi:hypothetical protein